MLDIKITKTTAPKEKPKGNLGFGRIFTDHMFVMDYTQGVGWHDPRIVPYQDLTVSPSAMVFHYRFIVSFASASRAACSISAA